MTKTPHSPKHPISALLLIFTIATLIITAGCLDPLRSSQRAADDDQQSMQFGPAALPIATVDQPYAVTISTQSEDGEIFAFEPANRSALPPGLTFYYESGTTTAEISGIPTKAGTYSFDLQALAYGPANGSQGGHIRYEITVSPSAMSPADQPLATVIDTSDAGRMVSAKGDAPTAIH